MAANSFKHFCQFRAKALGSKVYLIVGIDIAKDKPHAFFGTAQGKTLLRRLIFSNDNTGNNRLIEQVELLLKQHDLTEPVFGLEPTSNYHKPLAHWLIEPGHLVVLIGGKALKDNRELLDLNAVRSGRKSQDSIPVISKKGDADLRYALYQAALIASCHNTAFRCLYFRVLDGRQGERGIKTKARVKLVAKMLVIAWIMLKNNAAFDETRLLAESVQQR